MLLASLVTLVICVGLFTAVAAYTDVRWYKIPNAMTVPAFAAGLLFHFVRGMVEAPANSSMIVNGFSELLTWSLAGFAFGFGLFFALWCFGWAGGGDVKFMGAIGAWMGFKWTLAVYFVGVLFILFGTFFKLAKASFEKGFFRTVRSFAHATAKESKSRKKRANVTYAVPMTLAVWSLSAVLLASACTQTKLPFLGAVNTRVPTNAANG